MAQKASANGLLFRPHFKTHQSVETARWYKDEGIHTITVSSVTMANVFAGDGWNDITIAFPVNIRELDEISSIAGRIELNVLFDMPAQVEGALRRLGNPTGFFVKIDTGYHRAGVAPDDYNTIDRILNLTTGSPLIFKGFLTHSGNTYQARNREEILEIHTRSGRLLNHLKQHYLNRYPDIINSAGDTPSCSLADDFAGMDEIRPGNFVYYDLMQWMLGTCLFDEIAAAVICPVVSVYPERNEGLIYGGAVHLSKEALTAHNGKKIFGLVVPFTKGSWGNAEGDDFLLSVSQEHGVFRMESAWSKSLQPGDLVAVIPVHSCLAADLLKYNPAVFSR